LKKIVGDKLESVSGKDNQATRFYLGLTGALDHLSRLCLFYAERAGEMIDASTPANDGYLSDVRNALLNISEAAPSSFLEAVQLTHLYALISGSNNYGRMDDYLAPFYARDTRSGELDDEKTILILSSLWERINERKIIWDGRVIIGGRGRKHREDADELALLIMETTRRVQDVLPQLTLRCFEGMEQTLFDKALEVLGTGNTYPMLYNDDVNIPAAMKVFMVDEQTAKDCIPFGCGEYVIYHRSFGTPSGVVNLLKNLEVVLHKGIDPLTGRHAGTNQSQGSETGSFENLYKAWSRNLEHYIYLLALQEKFEYDFAGKTSPFLFLSLLFDSCIDKGKAIFDGGVDHLGGTLETYGNTNTADSLLAIKKLVFEEKRLTLAELVDVLDANFEGYEKIRKDCLDVPKYGNDEDQADAMMKRVHEDVCVMTMKMSEKAGLDSYLVVNINNNANTILGRFTSASADGRLSKTSMANGNTPSPGMDKNGATALLNSLVKMRSDIHAGASQNIKFSKEMLNRYLPMTKALIQTYFKQGGAQLMLTVVGKEDLEKAIQNPENYPNLLVRVGGFSARFVELEKDVQLEILQRTLY
ncbi:MAG TPA: pyruvate formate lyase family protein, partial [Bacteroidales bacterium]|nr:pyruvate formate lyase family protein [Bacteroidales bacterium]